eukprot:symbB.v1.2.007510.t1/scaffold444.1/size204903/10
MKHLENNRKAPAKEAFGNPFNAERSHLAANYTIWETHLGVPSSWISYAFPAWANCTAQFDRQRLKRWLFRSNPPAQWASAFSSVLLKGCIWRPRALRA